MLGTIVNVGAILFGSFIGGTLKKALPENIQKNLFIAMGLSAVFIGANAVLKNMPQSQEPILFIISLALGSILGTFAKFEERFQNIVNTYGKSQLAKGLSTAILLFCIGTLSILGPIESALHNNHTFLFTNATLDFITAIVLSASYGYGIMLSALILFLWQSSIYLGAIYISHFLQGSLLVELSIVGGILITASGLGILEIKDCKTLNLLPALLIPICYFLIFK